MNGVSWWGITWHKLGALTRALVTLDGAILSKMADRRQVVGGIVDGPLDLDAAVDATAAKTKHIVSPVAGTADVLLGPNRPRAWSWVHGCRSY